MMGRMSRRMGERWGGNEPDLGEGKKLARAVARQCQTLLNLETGVRLGSQETPLRRKSEGEGKVRGR